MTIRPATAADISGVLPMVASVCAFHQALDPAKYGFVSQVEQRYAHWLADRATDPRSVLLVAEREASGAETARLVGFVVATTERELPIYLVKEFGFIHDLWVEEAYRHEGLGRQLVTLVIERFAEMGVGQVRLDTAAANEPARKLFEACGFRPSITEMLLEMQGGGE